MFKGHVRARQGRFAEAIAEYSRAAAIRPDSPAPYCYRAHAYRRIKAYSKAVADYDRTLALQNEITANIWHSYQRATPLWILGRTDEALSDYRRFKVHFGRPWYSDARTALILREQGRDQEAEEVLASALECVGDRYPWLRQIFRCLAGELTPEELVADARDNHEQRCEACYYAGEACLAAGQTVAARRWFERCVQTGVEFDLDDFPLTPMNEYELAQWRLDSLPANPDSDIPP